MPNSLLLTAVLSTVFVVILLTWRIWPVARGRARMSDAPSRRLVKWNRYLLKLMRKTLSGRVAVAQAGFFTAKDGAEHAIATWALVPTVIPDVEFIALARPTEVDDDRAVEVVAVAEAEALRDLLEGVVREQDMWGHRAWLYSWPDDADLDAVVARLTPVEEFRARFGIAVPPPDDDGEAEGAAEA